MALGGYYQGTLHYYSVFVTLNFFSRLVILPEGVDILLGVEDTALEEDIAGVGFPGVGTALEEGTVPGEGRHHPFHHMEGERHPFF